MAFTFAAAVAWDSIGKKAVKSTSFQVYAMADTGFVTPLAITDTFGNALAGNILNSDTIGVFPEFKQADHPTVRITDSARNYIWTVTSVVADDSVAAFVGKSGSASEAAVKAAATSAVSTDLDNPASEIAGKLSATYGTPKLDKAEAATTYVVKKERTRPLGVTKTLLDNGSHPGFPGAVNAPDGNLLVAWREGANHAPSKGVIKAARYTQAGAVVTASTTILSDATFDARDPGLTVLKDGRIAMSYFIWDQTLEVPILDGMRVMFSSDSGVTWTAPVIVDSAFTTWAAGAGAVVELPNGDLLLPTYGVSAGQTFQHAHVSRSTDGGVTWSHLASMGNGDTQGGRHYQEPNIILTDRGDLLALMRSDQALAHYMTRSSDNGATWSTPTLAFPGNGAPRITNHGGYLHAIHRHEATGRTVKISSGDNGVTWGNQIALPASGSYLISSYGVAVPYGKDSLRYVYAMQTSAASNLATGVLLQVDSIVAEDRTALGPITCRVRNAGTVPLGTTATPTMWTTIPFSTEDHDTANMHSTTANTSRINVVYSGYYSVKGTVYFSASTAVQVQARVIKNGVTATWLPGLRDKKNPVANQDSLATAIGTVYLNAGDYVELQAYQDSGAVISARQEDTVFELTLLSAPI